MSNWGDGFAEGDSGYYEPGGPTRMWREIEDARRELASQPKRLRAASLPYVQADVLKIAEDETNETSARVAAYQLAWEMARYMAEADIDPVPGNG